MSALELRRGELAAVVDPARGSEIVSLSYRGAELLFRTPWRTRAQRALDGGAGASIGPVGDWLARYRGGWQTLVPTVGDPADYVGPAAYHGEASALQWEVGAADAAGAHLTASLFTVPLRIDRDIVLDGRGLSIRDRIVNESDVEVAFDYGHHPAFGSELLAGRLEVDAPGAAFTPDHDTTEQRPWPHGLAKDGSAFSLAQVAPSDRRGVYGWLEVPEARLRMRAEGPEVEVVLEWDSTTMPSLWVWQELGWDESFPWFGRARVAAFEPVSRPTRIGDRRGALRLPPRGELSTWIRVGISALP
ncbi:DUF4432 family protein [uncultured Leifsonia sp.]|uniref:DUF4432 family protein n=1 Tax=uncultured Leifsonia sp. TaxID=340359 RepID=UPI0028D2EAEE|nr:DUF4432 family protein [uncultured Leifsonia sp.]